MDGLNDAFAAYLKEIGWPGLLAGASGCSALSDVYRAYRMAHENWRAARAIYPERPWLRESEVRYGGLIRALAENKRIVRDAEENLQHLEKLYPNGEPLKFLSCYFLDCGMDLNMAAGKMFLHKNTLKYRRQKINELLGYPIEDVEKSYALVNMLALIRYEEVRQT
jgi:DNA-binding PucR family transcriptional regulator